MKKTIVMALEPYPDISLSDIQNRIELIECEKDLAILFAIAENKAWWVEDEIYDYEEGSDDYRKACEITDAWFELADKLKVLIFEILKLEGVSIPKTGQIEVLTPFMERNGFEDRNGWWVKK